MRIGNKWRFCRYVYSYALICTGRFVSADYLPKDADFYECEKDSKNGLGWIYFDDFAGI